MSRVDEAFARLKAARQKAFVPFITAGDPDLDFTTDLVVELAARGASVVEVGLPYSDPIADGPVIQASYTRALGRKIKVPDIWKALRKAADQVSIPLVTMTSFAIVHRVGADAFLDQAQGAGLSGAIVPDLPVEESPAFAERCRKRDFSLIQLVTPTTPRERAIRIAEASSGFLYYVSVTGITGERTALPPDLAENVSWLRQRTPLPVCIGFGISQPEQVRSLRDAADGIIVGSALVRRVAAGAELPKAELLADVGGLAGRLAAALSD